MRYGKKIIVWHECYVKGGSDWSIIDILTNWPNKNDKFDFFVNKKHQGIKLLKKYLYKKSNFNFYSSVIERLKILEKNKIFFYLLKIFIIRKLIGIMILILSFFTIHKKIKNKKSDFILINNGGYPGGLSSYLVIFSAFLLKKKTAMIIRNYPPCNYKKSITMVITKFIIQKFHCNIIAVSNSLKKSLVVDGGLQKEKIKVIYNGISIENKKKIQNIKKVKIRKLSVGIFGRVEHRKGHHLLLSAWKLVQIKLPNLNLYIVGNGNIKYIKELKKIIKSENLSRDKIMWISYTNNIYSLLKQIDLVIVPSINYESFGRIAVEAMALKKPIITSNFGGLKEININKRTGFIVNVKNKILFGNKIIELIKNKNKRTIFGKRGFKNYKGNFTASIMSKYYYEFVRQKLQIK